MSKIVVIGASHHNTLGMVRSVGEAGFRPDVIIYTEKPEHEFVSRSKYVNQAHIVGGCDESILKLLKENYGEADGGVVLLPGSDAVSELLNKNKEHLTGFLFPHCSSPDFSLIDCLDKAFMNRVAEANGFAVPKSVVVASGGDCEWQYTYPCIVKPLESAKGDKRDITICADVTALSKCLKHYEENGTTALIQEYILSQTEISTMGVSFGPKKECRLPNVIVKERFSNKSATYAKVMPIAQRPDFADTAEKIKQLIRSIGYTGIFDLDFLYSDGKYYFIELNLRNGAYGYGFTRGGLNFPADWCRYMLSGELPGQYEQEPIAIMNEFSDLKTVRKNKGSWLRWLREFFTAKHLILQAKDLGPVLAYVKGKM